jgi:death-on-curing protein
MITLSKEQIILLHARLIKETGGTDGIRDNGLLDSALSSPYHGFEGKDFYPTVYAKIARIAFGLISNHAFIDGNKRIGTYVMLALLELNRIETNLTDADELPPVKSTQEKIKH